MNEVFKIVSGVCDREYVTQSVFKFSMYNGSYLWSKSEVQYSKSFVD